MLIPQSEQIKLGNELHIARAISWVENKHVGYLELLKQLNGNTKIIGVTGPPGAGKSTLVNALVQHWSDQNQRIAILAVDPSSVFNFGSLLGDRLRMQNLFLLPNVYIRSISSRGSLGGLSASIIEILEVLKHAPFDKIIIETVGVGQSEVEIAGIADTTVVVSVPESGDEIQTLKSGVMEIADVFVVNKADREGALAFVSYLKKLAHSRATQHWEVPVISTQALSGIGIDELSQAIEKHATFNTSPERKITLLAEKAHLLIQQKRMKDLTVNKLKSQLEKDALLPNFNLFGWIEQF